MKKGFLTIAIATLLLAACQKETANNTSNEMGASNNKNKIGNFSYINNGSYTYYTHNDWNGSYDGRSWLDYSANEVSSFLGNSNYPIIETYAATTDTGADFTLNNVNGSGVQYVKTRREIKFPYYIVDPADSNMVTGTGKAVRIGGSYNVTAVSGESQNQVCIMQALQCNNKPQIQVLAHPQYNLIEVVITGDGTANGRASGMTYNSGGKYFWDNFSGGSTTGIYFTYSTWGTPFTIDLDINFTSNGSYGYVNATLNGDTSAVKHVSTPPSGAASNYACGYAKYTGATFFDLNMPGYYSNYVNAYTYATTSTHAQGIAWSFGAYADWESTTATYGSKVHVSKVWSKGIDKSTLLASDFDLLGHTNAFTKYTVASPFAY